MTRACLTGARARRIVLSARKTTTLEARARASGLARCACRLVFFFARGRCATPSARRTRRLRPRTSPRPRRCARAWSTGPGSSTSSCRADITSTWAPPSSARRTPRRDPRTAFTTAALSPSTARTWDCTTSSPAPTAPTVRAPSTTPRDARPPTIRHFRDEPTLRERRLARSNPSEVGVASFKQEIAEARFFRASSRIRRLCDFLTRHR